MRPTLCTDVDSTVWDTATWVREAVLEVTGDELDLGAVFTWTHILDAYGEEATTQIFERVLSPERIREREPYPGAPEVFLHLQRERGVKIHFVTRAHDDPEAVRPHLEPWLREHFGPEVRLTITARDKLDILQELGAAGLIDDRPEILERAAEAGLWTAARIQPWNRGLVAARSDIHGFSDWREVLDLISLNKREAQSEQSSRWLL